MREKILELHHQWPGLSHRAIARKMDCRSTSVDYHLSPNRKTNSRTSDSRLRHSKKEILIEENGGKCSKCGYKKCYRALEFHHKDPTKKKFSISNCRGRSLAKLREEVKKCILICSNCHAELHEELEKNLPV